MSRRRPKSSSSLRRRDNKEAVGKGGVVRDEDERSASIQRVVDVAESVGAQCHGVMDSPVPGAKKGNIEALIHLTLGGT